jgi:hypothetical protein
MGASSSLAATPPPPAPAAPRNPTRLVAPQKHDEIHEARRVVAEAADHALGSSGVERLLTMVDQADRNRIQQNDSKDYRAQYQQVADDIRSKWQYQFKEPFSAEGMIDQMGGIKPTITGTGHNQKAVIQLPAQPGEKAYELRLVRAPNGYWKFNIPDAVKGKAFQRAMLDSVKRLQSQMGKLPSDKAQAAQRVVSEALHALAFPSSAQS